MGSDIIPADIEINEQIVQFLLAEQFGLVGRKIQLLGEGFDNAVYKVDDDFVFRFPRRQEAVVTIEREIEILPHLVGHLSVRIPTPIFIGKPSQQFNRIFYGHNYLKGISGSAISLSFNEYKKAASNIGQFLKQLHSIDITKLGLSSQQMEPSFDRADFKKLWRVFEARLKDVEKNYDLNLYREKIILIGENAESYDPPTTTKTFVHGDLYHRHLIFDDNHNLSAVIDWGDSAIGDPVVDLSIVFQFLPRFAHQAFFSAYKKIDDSTSAYARFLGLYYAIALLWFGHSRKDQDLIRTSLWTLQEI